MGTDDQRARALRAATKSDLKTPVTKETFWKLFWAAAIVSIFLYVITMSLISEDCNEGRTYDPAACEDLSAGRDGS